MGQLNLPDSSLVYVDTVVVIYSIEKFPSYFPLLERLWQKLKTGAIQIMTSEITLLETLVMPIRQSNTNLIRRYEALLFSPEMSLVPINQPILRSAATLRAQTNLKTPDAIHAATALNRNCTLFLTNDADLRKVPGLSVVVLKDVLNA
jgi:predicted nucleic acid-binding protein